MTINRKSHHLMLDIEGKKKVMWLFLYSVCKLLVSTVFKVHVKHNSTFT